MSMPGMIPNHRDIARASKKRQRRSKNIGTALIAIGTGIALATGIVLLATSAGATSQVQINKFIRANDGIPPCTEEDGSGQPGMCVWDDGDGDAIVNVPTKPGKDKRVVILINR